MYTTCMKIYTVCVQIVHPKTESMVKSHIKAIHGLLRQTLAGLHNQ